MSSRKRINLLAIMSLLAGFFLVIGTALLPRAEGLSHWSFMYMVLSAQELLLFAVPALLWYQVSVDGKLRLSKLLERPLSADLGFSSLLASSFALTTILITSLWYLFLDRLGMKFPADMPSIVPQSPAELIVSILCAAVIPAIAEELMFRGLLLDILGRKFGPQAASVVTSLLFAVLHFNLLGGLSLLVMGLVLAALRLVAKSLWPPVLLHLVYNLLALLLNYLKAQPSPSAVMISAVVFFGTLTWYLRKVRRTA